MTHWHNRPVAGIGLRLAGLALIASLWPQGSVLRTLVTRSDAVTPTHMLLAASCFACASLGAMLLFWGTDLWKPVSVARRWHSYAIEEGGDGMGHKKSPRTADDACSSPEGRPGSQHRMTLERA